MEFICRNLEETAKVAREFLEKLPKKDDQATIIGLQGELGSGKTAFGQLVARELGVAEAITSPTFVIEKKYEIPAGETANRPFRRLVHIDCYRLNSGQDLLRLDWKEIVSDPQNLILIEWPEIISDIWPTDAPKIFFEFVDEGTRKISWGNIESTQCLENR